MGLIRLDNEIIFIFGFIFKVMNDHDPKENPGGQVQAASQPEELEGMVYGLSSNLAFGRSRLPWNCRAVFSLPC